MAGNHKCGLRNVTAGYRTNYIARKGMAAKRLRKFGAICIGRASILYRNTSLSFITILLPLKYIQIGHWLGQIKACVSPYLM
jgi:hypothetical protein